MINWNKRECWVAVFDILGFKNMIRDTDRDFPRAILTSKIEELLESLNTETKHEGNLEHFTFSDTIVISAQDLRGSSYPWFLHQCKNLITKSIYIRLPLRGAISAGTIFTDDEHRIFMGSAFIEAYEYCEDQDWIGLLIAPTATRALRNEGLDPLRHHFIQDVLPLKTLPSNDVLAYRFQDGSSNFDNPLLSCLHEMQHFAPEKDKQKYDRTIKHIQRYHKYNTGS